MHLDFAFLLLVSINLVSRTDEVKIDTGTLNSIDNALQARLEHYKQSSFQKWAELQN